MESAPVRARGFLFAALCAAAAGTAVAVGKLAMRDGISPLAFSFWLFAFATPLSGVWARLRREVTHSRSATWKLAAGHAALSFVAVWAFWAGVQRLNPAVASFLGRVEPLVTVGLALLVLRERLGRLEAAGGLIAVAGVVLMKLPAGEAGADATGYWLALGAAVCFGSAELFAKFSVPHCGPATFVFRRNALLLAMFGVAAALAGELALPSAGVLAVVAAVALLAPAGARVFYMLALRSLALSKTAVIGQAQPLFAALGAFALLRTLPRPWEWTGGALILLGCSFLVLGAPRLSPVPESGSTGPTGR
jgi:drug/metabolite transporter (DMT)-like permease